MKYDKDGFSVLMPVYVKENPDYLDRALASIWDQQTLKPAEIVLVEDGPLSDSLYAIIDKWRCRLKNKLKIVKLSTNFGLGEALNCGLEACDYEIVARMDSDDIASKNRFAVQINLIQKNNFDVLSSWVDEFEINESDIIRTKIVPENHYDIMKFSKIRNPLNHPAVVFRKASVIQAGGYKKMMLFEDYYLWIRMIMNGASFYNVQSSLLKMRVGNGQINRRRGFGYFAKELNFQYELLCIGFIGLFGFAKNIIYRGVIRLFPKQIVEIVYSFLRS